MLFTHNEKSEYTILCFNASSSALNIFVTFLVGALGVTIILNTCKSPETVRIICDWWKRMMQESQSLVR